MAEFTLTVNAEEPDPRDPVSVFHLGQGFYLAGNRCLLNIEVGPNITQCLVSPGVVNMALSIELFLKAVIIFNGDDVPKTHNLKKLFERVPGDFISNISNQYEQRVKAPTFSEHINLVSDYFVKVRYGHEFNIFAYQEYPISQLAKILYVETAKLLGEKIGLDKVHV